MSHRRPHLITALTLCALPLAACSAEAGSLPPVAPLRDCSIDENGSAAPARLGAAA